MKLRFAVGVPGVSQSSSWKLWTQGNETYMLTRQTGEDHKFSFHSSGVCRWALAQERTDGRDRAMLKWRRPSVPATGSRGGTLLLSIVFPTSHLSAYADVFTKPVRWINPAPQGAGTNIDVFLTKEGGSVVEKAFMERAERELLAFGALRDGPNVGVAASFVDCGPIDLQSPASPALPGTVFGDLAFPERDTLGTGRPIRMLIVSPAEAEGAAPTAWEIGGYEASRLDTGA
jgi:hypothetical protein